MPLPTRLADVDQEHREPFGALLHLLDRRRAREQQHQVGMQRARGPDLLAADDIAVVALLHRAGLQLGGVGAGGRLGDAERLQAHFAARDARQVALLLLRAAVAQQRAHDVHLRVALRRRAARDVDLFQDRGGRADRQAGAAVFLRDQRREDSRPRSGR